MTKGQKEILKEIEKAVKYVMKQNINRADCKIVSNCIYKKLGDYLISAIYFVRFSDNQYKLTLRYNIKLYYYDNIFWEVFDMKENSLQKDSFRVNGAYTAPSIQWDEKTYTITNISEVEQVCMEAINEFITESKLFIEKILSDYGNFDLFILKQVGIMDEMLLKMLAYINMNKYTDAEYIANTELKQGRGGRFQNNGIDINEYVLMYCRKKQFK
ncbi:MAG TPA: hypothetical protein GX392_08185 [Clostridiales bacterium]|nr:hypothetical protein [Clostridiales bacterium]